MTLRTWLKSVGLSRSRILWIPTQRVVGKWFLVTRFTDEQRQRIVFSGDPVRYGTLLLALEQIIADQVPGALAECGVYKGHLSKFIHAVLPDRKYYLFDTFQGFDTRDSLTGGDLRFRDTSEEEVLDYIGDRRNIVIRKGYFPQTAAGLDDERFAFTVIDFDKYEPTAAALEFFYDRTSPGGFVVVHDYNNPESNWACSRALDEFLADKPEHPIVIPDAWGTALFRRTE
jgi:O-methyltransferase